MWLHVALERLQTIGTDEFFDVGEDHIAIGTLEACNLAVEFAAHPYVVGVQKREQFALGEINAVIARRRRAGLPLADIADTTVPKRPHRLGGQICRAVVDNDDLKIRRGLRGNACQGVGHVGLPVEHGYDYAYGIFHRLCILHECNEGIPTFELLRHRSRSGVWKRNHDAPGGVTDDTISTE